MSDQDVQAQQSRGRFRLVAFSALGLVAALLVLLFPALTPEQHFYLRILIGLSAAGVAAVIPGFFEIELTWLKNVIRAGGAIGIFVLIYTRNPPDITSPGNLQTLEGDWTYVCISLGDPFPHGGTHHGGTAHIQVVDGPYGRYLAIIGERTWVGSGKERKPLKAPSSWETISANVASGDRLVYEYTTTEGGTDYRGFSSHRVVQGERGDVVRLDGRFFRLQEPYTEGRVVFTRSEP